MLRKFTNAKTGQTIIFDKGMKPTLENVENVIGEKIKGSIPFQTEEGKASNKKDSSSNKKK